MRKILAFLIAASALAAATPAAAELVSARAPRTIAALIESRGWQVDVIDANDGDPYLKASRDGELFVVGFMNCTDGRNCRTLQFFMGFTDVPGVTLARLNEWNRDKRFGRAYRDDDGDPVLAMDVDLDFEGLPRENVDEILSTWTALMDTFRKYIIEG